MAVLRFKHQETFVPHPGYSAQMMVKYFDASYFSNRENGQVVKRESPFNLLSGEYSGYSNKTANLDIQTTTSYAANASWTGTSSQSYARAYRKFQRLASVPRAEVLLNVVEGRKSLDMIAARTFQIVNLAKALRSGRLGDAWRYMSLNPNLSLRDLLRGGRLSGFSRSRGDSKKAVDNARARRQLIKDVSSVILEWRYGWSPLMQDIQNAVEVLQKPYPPTKIIARGSYNGSQKLFTYGGSAAITEHFSEHVTCRGTIQVTNPNLALANQLGFINLAYVAWEAIPFSFVVDWFLPVGNFLNNFTSYAGLTLSDASITMRRKSSVVDYPSTEYVGDYTYVTGKPIRVHSKKITRTVGIDLLPRPPLVLGTGLTPGRALNAVALLGQMFDGRSYRSAGHG